MADEHIVFAVLVTTAVGMNGSSLRLWNDRSFDVMEQFDVAAHVIAHATHCCPAVVAGNLQARTRRSMSGSDVTAPVSSS